MFIVGCARTFNFGRVRVGRGDQDSSSGKHQAEAHPAGSQDQSRHRGKRTECQDVSFVMAKELLETF